ncbi:MAG: hypothetical protein ACTSYI_17980, partial [Promethearchaeota archaeon]
NSAQRRNIQERIEAIFKFMEMQDDIFPKSRLKEIGLNPLAAEKWLRLIEYIQNQPKIRLISSGHNTLIEKVEGKYQALMRKMVSDESVPFEERLQYNTNYLKSLYTRERMNLQTNRLPDSTNVSLDSKISALRILALLDKGFDEILEKFIQVSSIVDEGDRSIALLTVQKKFMIDSSLQSNLQAILDNKSTRSRIKMIGELDPSNYMNFAKWKKAILTLFLI